MSGELETPGGGRGGEEEEEEESKMTLLPELIVLISHREKSLEGKDALQRSQQQEGDKGMEGWTGGAPFCLRNSKC